MRNEYCVQTKYTLKPFDPFKCDIHLFQHTVQRLRTADVKADEYSI